jgi:phosphatidylglycerol lysyltransferase
MPTHTLRQAFVANAFPPFAVDALHLLASAVGVALLLVGHALRHHVFAAYRISQCLLVIGATTVLLKGFEVGVAVFLILTLLVHLPFASSFYRRISILKLPYTRRWLTAIFLTLLGSVWVGFFYFKHLEKAALLPDMWFDFSQHSEAFLFLRASLIATFLALAWILLASLWRVHPRLLRPKLLTLEQCKDIFGALLDYRHARTFSPHRAVLLDRDGKSALCCVHRHCFWIALGDPLGDFSEARNLLWQFRELAEATHQQMFMLGVTENFRQSSYDIGLECFPFVEEAIVDLKNNLALPESAQQFTTRVLTAEMKEYPSLAELQKLYSDWFSDSKDLSANIWETDLSRALDLSLPIIFLYEEGNPVGFSLLLTAKDMSIAACDHLRLSKNSGHQALSSIFSGAVLWAAESGYSAFSLGMAPFKNDSAASLPLLRSTEILAPHICLGADFVSSPSELRECKESFAPKWRPRFLAATSGLRLPAVIQEIHGLFHSGWSGNFPYPGQPKNPLV